MKQLMTACDEHDKKFLHEKYGFKKADFIAVQKLFNKGFSTMKAAQIVAKRKEN